MVPQTPFSIADHNRLRRSTPIPIEGKWTSHYGTLTIEEQWRWHAYMRCTWMHARGIWPPPFDPTLKWADAEFDHEAERVWREMHPPKRAPKRAALYRKPAHKPADDVVRPYWRELRQSDLTVAEFALAVPEIEAYVREFKANLARFAENQRMTTRYDDGRKYRPRTPAPTRLPPVGDPVAAEWMRKMEQ